MKTTTALTIGLVLATGALMAGCTPVSPEPTPTSSETVSPAPTETSAPESPESMEQRLDDLRADVAATSVGCENFVVVAEGPAGSIGGTCDDKWTLFVFDTTESRNTVLTLNQDSLEPMRFIVGPGWLIALSETAPIEELDALAVELGYPVWLHTDPVPET
jgi:hypothetical protein